MTTPRDLRAWRRLHDRAESMIQRELDRPKLCDRNRPIPSWYDDLRDELAILRRKLRELDRETKGPTWEKIFQDQQPKPRPGERRGAVG